MCLNNYFQCFFSQHGESAYNQLGKIGGDSDLSERGCKFGNALAEYIKEQKIPKVSSSELPYTC